MRTRIDRFRAEALRDETRAVGRTWFSRRLAWAAVSVLLLVSGSLLQGLGVRSPLAERISSVMTEVSEFEPTRHPGNAPEIRLIDPERQPARLPLDREK